MKKFFWLIIVLVIIGGGLYIWQKNKLVDVTYQPPNAPDNNVDVPDEPIVDDETKDWQTYRNEEYGFEFKYPSNFKVTESTNVSRLYVSVGEYDKPSHEFSLSLTLNDIKNATSDGDYLSNFLAMVQEGHMARPANDSEKPKIVKVNNNPALFYAGYTTQALGWEMHYIFARRGISYDFRASADSNVSDVVKTNIRKMLSSFIFF